MKWLSRALWMFAVEWHAEGCRHPVPCMGLSIMGDGVRLPDSPGCKRGWRLAARAVLAGAPVAAKSVFS